MLSSKILCYLLVFIIANISLMAEFDMIFAVPFAISIDNRGGEWDGWWGGVGWNGEGWVG